MRKFRLNKLVRDNITDEMIRDGQKPVTRTLNDAEYVRELVRKLREEAGELTADDVNEALKELADLLEVAEALAIALGADFDKLRKVQAERKAKRGGFAKRIYIERVDLTDDDPWVDYYAKEPARFPEVKE